MIDAGILEDILFHIHNWFDTDAIRVVADVAIANGELPASVSSKIPSGAWYRIEGSYLNDGLHLHPATDLEDEDFRGTVTVLRIPRPLLRLAEEISAWQLANGSAVDGPYASESFGGYSYTIKCDNGSGSGSGGLSGWRLAFRDRLNAFRKMS